MHFYGSILLTRQMQVEASATYEVNTVYVTQWSLNRLTNRMTFHSFISFTTRITTMKHVLSWGAVTNMAADEDDKKIKKKGNYMAFYVYISTNSAIRFEIESLIYVLCRFKVWLM